MTQNRNRAIVLGGSVAGTLAARVLSDSYREVLVVDRDKLLGVREPRRGAPHTVHAHGLLARGHMIMEELFPGITDEMSASGVPTYDIGEIHWYFNSQRLKIAQTGLVSVAARRPILEAFIRAKVAERPNVVFLEQCDILEPVASADGTRIDGVKIQRQGEDDEASEPETLTADLVVDATGRGSRTPAWLESLGYQRPEEERIKIGLAYTTRHYRMPRGAPAINVIASPASHRGAFFAPVGPDTYILTLNGMLGDHPPTEPEGFEAFLRSLPVPDIADALRDAEPIDEPTRFTFPASVRKRYEQLSRFPEGLLVVGDSVCSFNPLYGQGMSVAALEAITLRRHLAEGGQPSPLRFLKDVAAVVDVPWEMAANSDLNFPEVEGKRTAKVRFLNAYIGRVQRAATRDAKITDAFMRVAGLLDPPPALMMPRTLLRVLGKGARKAPPPARMPAPPAVPRIQVPNSEN
jgi:2-polyprenyl-6-methoxyphenol hydroxylase-like FAD-dependent oxidoreductase